MSTTKFRTRRRAKALAFTMVLIATPACNPTSRSPPDDANPPLEVKKISSSRFQDTEIDSKDDALVAECARWQLTKEQAQHFFKISRPYEENPYSEFYQLPCSIDGVVEAEGKTWEFTINAGATAVWRNGEEIRYFGCSAADCKSLVLMMPDGMNP